MRLPSLIRRILRLPDPHWSGWVACWHCDHEWHQVVPVQDGQAKPVGNLECPCCGLKSGVPR